LRRSLPTLEGVVELPDLGGSVEVLRDRFGVPQIFASCEEDLFFTQGYVHAQDRFFQMELGRRAGHGRLSELLGESALGFDRLSRTVGFGRIATFSTKELFGRGKRLSHHRATPPRAFPLARVVSRAVDARRYRCLVRGHGLEPLR
jgi:penicillin amidase